MYQYTDNPRTIEELEKWLIRKDYPKNHLTCGKYFFTVEGYGIENNNGQFSWYYSERGKRSYLNYFKSEKDIVEFALEEFIGKPKESIASEILEKLDFLITEFNFIKIPEYSYGKKNYNEFVNIENRIIIKINYEGDFWCEIFKARNNLDLYSYTLSNGRKIDYNDKYFEFLRLKELEFKSMSGIENQLFYISKTLQDNNELLRGNVKQFSFINRLFNMV